MPEVVVEEEVTVTETADTANATSVELSDLLVEDVSIDSMCGVY